MSWEDYSWDYGSPYEWMKMVRKSSLPPLVVCCAITGGGQGKEANPNLPETPEEQAEQASGAYEAGASMVHIHARDPNNLTFCSGDSKLYYKINGMVREKCPDIIINNTTGGGAGMTPEERACVMDANPEVASLNMGPAMVRMTFKERKKPLFHPRPDFHFEGCIDHNFGEISMLAGRMKKKGVKPEMEIFHSGQYWAFDDLMQKELISPPYLFQFVLGYQSGFYPTPANLLSLVNELPANSVYEVLGVGQFQLPMTVMAILMGGHVRVGLEDNIYAKKGKLYTSNAEAVERIVRIARDINREIATPKQAREIFGLSPKPTTYG